jgi:hypothetical protein
MTPTKFKAGDWVRNTDIGGTLGVFTRYVKPHGGLPMCEVRVGNVIHICREYLLGEGKGNTTCWRSGMKGG